MKTVRIFIASSINDFHVQRMELGTFLGELNSLNQGRELTIEYEICENGSNAMRRGRKQKEYNELIRRCDYFYLLVGGRIGRYTEEEFDTARQTYEQTEKPLIYTYFTPDQGDDSVIRFKKRLRDDYDHFTSVFTHIDSIKLNILMELKRDDVLGGMEFRDGAVVSGGKTLMPLDNVPVYAGHGELRQLRQEKAQWDGEFVRLRTELALDPMNDAVLGELMTVGARRKELGERINDAENALLELFTAVSKFGADGRPLTDRELRARELLDAGNADSALTMLRDAERERELRQAEAVANSAIDRIRGYIGENMLKIHLLRWKGLFDEAEKCFTECVELAERYNTELAVMLEYARFLMGRNRPSEAVAVGERLKAHYELTPPSDMEKAALFNLLGICYDRLGEFYKSAKSYSDAAQILMELSQSDPTVKPMLAASLTNYAAKLTEAGRYDDANRIYRLSLRIYSELSEKTAAYPDEFAVACGNAAYLSRIEKKYDIAEKLYRSAARYLEGGKRGGELCRIYGNMAAMYLETGRTDESKMYYTKALELARKFAAEDPVFRGPTLADACCNMGLYLYNTEHDHDGGLKLLREAERIYRRYPHLEKRADELKKALEGAKNG